MTELMDPTLAARALSAATEITSTALSGDDPGAVLDTVVARAAELADADLGLAMVSTEDGRVVVEAAHYATAHPAADGHGRTGAAQAAPAGGPDSGAHAGAPPAALGGAGPTAASAGQASLDGSARPTGSAEPVAHAGSDTAEPA